MKNQYLEAGEIVGTHGIRGEVKIMPWCDGPDFLKAFHTFYIEGTPYKVEAARVHKNMLLCKLQGVDDVSIAQTFKNKVVKIDRDSAPVAKGRVFIADLIGLPVYAEGEEIGTLKDVYSGPANDVYIVKGKREYMIPAVSEFLEDVNPDEGYIKVKLLEGMATDEN
ncbi:MAG: ribosome maturation factor RimM [Oscillospiraceae bacterium]|nr:ribosome maturation factor RimM [Oscillospiraceae bacterium]